MVIPKHPGKDMDSDTGNVQAMAGTLSKNMWTDRENSFQQEDNSEFNLHRLGFGTRMVQRGKRENIALLLDDSVDSVSSQVTLSKTLRVRPFLEMLTQSYRVGSLRHVGYRVN